MSAANLVPIAGHINGNFLLQGDLNRVLDDYDVPLQKFTDENYPSINIARLVQQLDPIAPLLTLAYSGSVRYACNEKVFDVANKYLMFLKSVRLTCVESNDLYLDAMRAHALAMKRLNINKVDRALLAFNGIQEVAEKMVAIAKDRMEEIGRLCERSFEAITSTREDDRQAYEEKCKVEERMGEHQVEKEVIGTKRDDLGKAIAEAKTEERKVEKKVDKAHRRVYIQSMVSTVLNPISAVAQAVVGHFSGSAAASNAAGAAGSIIDKVKGNPQVKKAEEKEQKIREELQELRDQLAEKEGLLSNETDVDARKELQGAIAKLKSQIGAKETELQQAEQKKEKTISELEKGLRAVERRLEEVTARRVALQKEWRQMNASLAESVERLKNLSAKKNTLEAAIVSLEISVKALGRIYMAFNEMHIYWSTVKLSCTSVARLGSLRSAVELDEEELEETLEGTLSVSFISWLALAHMNRSAKSATLDMYADAGAFMRNIPTEKEAKKLIGQVSDDMLAYLHEENEKLGAV